MRRAGVSAPDHADPLADAQPGDRVVARRRHEPQHRARRHRAALVVRRTRQDRTHGVVLMVELGDLREGIMPGDLDDVVGRDAATSRTSRCAASAPTSPARAASSPTARTWPSCPRSRTRSRRPSASTLDIVSGGNSANLDWALGAEPTSAASTTCASANRSSSAASRCTAHPIDGLHTDAFTLVAEVIESKVEAVAAMGRARPDRVRRPRRPTGDRGDVGPGDRRRSAARTSTPTGLAPPDGFDDPRRQQRPPRPRRRRAPPGRRLRGSLRRSTTAPCCAP